MSKVKNAANVRKSEIRKTITRELRQLETIRKSLERTVVVVTENGANLKGDANSQLADLLRQLNVAVTVVESNVTEKANALARTFIK